VFFGGTNENVSFERAVFRASPGFLLTATATSDVNSMKAQEVVPRL
jgi:hypothetical protein